MTTAPIAGRCDERFLPVRDAFAANFAEQGEVGAAVCVIVDGEPVVDLVGGYADRARTMPWAPDTIVDFYSVGKALVALSVLRLVDAGRIGLDDPIASVWPEFAAGGKETRDRPARAVPPRRRPRDPRAADRTTTCGRGRG